MLEVGKKAPDFELPDQNGEMHKLSDYAGKKVILYFYPKDNTPGCTKQACGFSERYPQFTEKGAVILGVSKDSVASHKRFEEKYGLAFTLLADPERKVIEAYDVWKEKKNYGKVSMGVVRTTYLIDEQGIIIKANDKVKAADDPENMLDCRMSVQHSRIFSLAEFPADGRSAHREPLHLRGKSSIRGFQIKTDHGSVVMCQRKFKMSRVRQAAVQL